MRKGMYNDVDYVCLLSSRGCLAGWDRALDGTQGRAHLSHYIPARIHVRFIHRAFFLHSWVWPAALAITYLTDQRLIRCTLCGLSFWTSRAILAQAHIFLHSWVRLAALAITYLTDQRLTRCTLRGLSFWASRAISAQAHILLHSFSGRLPWLAIMGSICIRMIHICQVTL